MQRLFGQAELGAPSSPGLPSANRLPRRSYSQAGLRALGFVPYRVAAMPEKPPALLVAFYLPQFHAIPENDERFLKVLNREEATFSNIA